MKRHLLMAVAFLVIACAPLLRQGTTPSGESCPIVTVDNQAFEDVRVRFIPTNYRMGVVPGGTQQTFQTCRIVGYQGQFRIDAIGGAFDYPLQRTGPRMGVGDSIGVVVARHPRFSRIIG